jgi:mRNA-degrading endonuclease RelE of RelBE toxin-antitoxin system
MGYEVKSISVFERQVKRLTKKYRSLKTDLLKLVDHLKVNPRQGTPVGKDCYKIRLAITSKGKGKSGGARVLTHVVITDSTVYLISIYDKSEKENLTNKELEELLLSISKV